VEATTQIISSEARSGDPFFAASLVDMTPSQRDKAIREHCSHEYRAEIRRLMALGVGEPEKDS
jgi:hypothetical protein